MVEDGAGVEDAGVAGVDRVEDAGVKTGAVAFSWDDDAFSAASIMLLWH